MSSLWSLGEGSGFPGTNLSIQRIICPFCMEQGNFSSAHVSKKKHARTSKTLNFETLRCGNCAGFVMVLWSTAISGRVHDFRVLPRPTRLEKFPEYWPEPVGRHWLQAHRSMSDENWDAAAVMARSALQAALRDQGATGKNFYQEIESLKDQGLLPPLMVDWAHEVRELGNDSAHPDPTKDPTDPADALDIVRFLDYALEYLYDLPHRIEEYRKRRDEE